MIRHLSRAGVLLGVLLLTITSGMAAIQVEVDGRPLSFRVPPTRVSGRTMVPLRGIFESLRAQVNWNANTSTITAIKGATDVRLSIGDPRATVNGQTVLLDAPAMILNGSTMVPLRFVGEALGADVKWFEATQTVSITTGVAVLPEDATRPAGLGQVAAQGQIQFSGVRPFVYDNQAYVPVKSTCDYLGAGFTWDPDANSATVVYRNRNLTLVVGTTSAYYNDEPVALTAPVVVVRDQLYCPATAFDRYLGVPMRWEPQRHRASFQGQPGWGYYDVDPRTPSYALGVFAGYGYVPAYAPTPFVYGGATYLPLRSVADVIGAALLFDLLSDRCVVTYGGVQTVLFIGSPSAYYGDQVVALTAAPIVCNNVVYVPEQLVADQWRVPVQHEGGRFRLQGDRGWHDFTVRAAPPATIYRSMAAAPLLRTAAAGLRSVGMTRPMAPGLVSRAGRVPTTGRPGTLGRTSGGPATGFPALAATRPRGGAVAAPQRGPGRPQGGAVAAPQRGPGRAKGGAVAAPQRGPARPQGGAVAAPRRGPARPQGGAVAAPRAGLGKAQGGAAAAPRRGSGKAQGSSPQGKGGKGGQPKERGDQGHSGG